MNGPNHSQLTGQAVAEVADGVPQHTGGHENLPRTARAASMARRPMVDSVVHGIRSAIGAWVTLLIMVVFLGSTESTFLTVANWKNVLISNSPLFIAAAGMTVVMISGGFDLSIGSVMAVAGLAAYRILDAGLPAGLAIVLVLILGFVIGAVINGILIGFLGANFIMVTLGSMTLLYGLVDVSSNGATETITSHTLGDLGLGQIAGIPTPVIIMVVVLVVTAFTLRFTSFGRTIFAVGGNREAARLAGIRVSLVVMLVYGIAGLCGAMAGLVEAGRLASADPTAGSTLALTSGAAALLGGTTISGGVGTVQGTVAGVLVISVLGNGVNLLGVSNFWQQVVTGGVLLGAVIMSRLQKGSGRIQLLTVLRGSAKKERR